MTTIESTNTIQHPSLIPDQEQISAQFGGDTAAELAAMVFLFARERRQDAAEQRELTEQRIETAEAEQVDELHEQATYAMWGAFFNGAAQIASGAGQIGSGCKLAVGDEATAAMRQGGGEAFGGVLQLGGAISQGEAGHHEASAQEASHAADAAKRDMDEVNENRDEAQELGNRVLDFLDEIQKLKAEGQQAVWVKG